MEPDMRESGKMIYSMDRVKRYGLIIQCMKVITMKVKNMEKVYIFGKTDQATTEIGTKTE
jgi:lipopolysaccharide/colanic/teichoic acid biosynthesis glycosyltransferase